MPRPRATAKDVARLSGVSPTTVSFVLNRTPGQTIPDQTRERVIAAARELDYAPHAIARTLREGSSRIVLLSSAGLPAGHSLQSYVDGLREGLAEAGWSVLVVAGDPTPDELHRLRDSIAAHTVLELGRATFHEGADDGGWVSGLAAHAATQVGHLAARGHRHIAVAAPERPDRLVELRSEHVRDAATAAGLNCLPTPVTITGLRRVDGDRLAELRRQHPEVTALACFDDDTALAALAALRELGVAVPREMAVIGFDDTRHGALWDPALTTVHIDAAGFGRRQAAEILGQTPPAAVATSTVIVRESA